MANCGASASATTPPKYAPAAIDPTGVEIDADMQKYFADLKDAHGIELSAAQKAWYVKKYETQQEDMLKSRSPAAAPTTWRGGSPPPVAHLDSLPDRAGLANQARRSRSATV